jgi:hypothetical protein
LEGDGIELIADSISDSCEDSVENSSADEDLQAALKEQLKISTQSSDLITETENFLANVKAEVSTAGEYLNLADDTSSNKDNNTRLSDDESTTSEVTGGNKKRLTEAEKMKLLFAKIKKEKKSK